MLKNREPQGWKYFGVVCVDEQSGKPKQHQWRYYGEVELSLKLHQEPVGKFYEMAQILTNRFLVQHLATFSIDRALKAVSQNRRWPHPDWQGRSPEELEQYCEQRLLPLPDGYRKYWNEMA